MRFLLLLLALATLGWGQIQADAYPQDIFIGPYRQYAVTVCNGSNQPITLQGANVWRQIQQIGPVLTSTVLATQANLRKTSTKQKALYVIGAASAAIAVLSGSQAIKVSPDTTGGKVYYSALAAASLGLPLLATQIDRAPEEEVAIPLDQMLPGVVVLAANECKQYIQYGSK